MNWSEKYYEGLNEEQHTINNGGKNDTTTITKLKNN